MKKHIGKAKEAYSRTIGEKGDLWESAYQVANLQEFVDMGANAILKDKATIHSRPKVGALERENAGETETFHALERKNEEAVTV